MQLFGSIEDAVAYVRRKRTLSEFIAEKRTELSVQVAPPEPEPYAYAHSSFSLKFFLFLLPFEFWELFGAT
jgi:hypothetical protein